MMPIVTKNELVQQKYEDFASEAISRENLFLIRANTKYGQAVRVNARYIT